MTSWVGRFILVLLAVCATVTVLPAKETRNATTFAAWLGVWEGELNIYAATGDRIEMRKVRMTLAPEGPPARGLIKVSIITQYRGIEERQNGVIVGDDVGWRRIVKTEGGQPVEDLRGRILGPVKLYWFSVDARAVVRESILETLEGNVIRVNGFRWDGEMGGSYRILEGRYTRTKEVAKESPSKS